MKADAKNQKIDRLVRDVQLYVWQSLRMGDWFTENQLMEKFGFSRRMARRIVMELVKDGLLISRKGVGIQVRSVTPRQVQSSFGLRWALDRYLIEQMECSFENGKYLNLQIVDEAQAKLEKLAEPLIAAATRRIETVDGLEVFQADLAVHEALAAAVGMDEAIPIIRQLTLIVRLAAPAPTSLEEVKCIVAEHRSVLDHVHNKNWKGAAKAIRQHYLKSMQRFQFNSDSTVFNLPRSQKKTGEP